MYLQNIKIDIEDNMSELSATPKKRRGRPKKNNKF